MLMLLKAYEYSLKNLHYSNLTVVSLYSNLYSRHMFVTSCMSLQFYISSIKKLDSLELIIEIGLIEICVFLA